MQSLSDIAPYVALGSAVLSLVLLVLVVVLLVRVARLRRAQTVVLGHSEQRDIVAHSEELASQVRNLREAVEILTDQLDAQKRHLDHALTHRAIIRYDAFRDAGGEQSASFALLDEYRSGVVFSAIAARDFARIYVKHLSDGVADRDLSPEEAKAVAAAVPRPLQRRRRRPARGAGPPARERAARASGRRSGPGRRARGRLIRDPARGGRSVRRPSGGRRARRFAGRPGRRAGAGRHGRLHLGAASRAASPGRSPRRPLKRPGSTDAPRQLKPHAISSPPQVPTNALAAIAASPARGLIA